MIMAGDGFWLSFSVEAGDEGWAARPVEQPQQPASWRIKMNASPFPPLNKKNSLYKEERSRKGQEDQSISRYISWDASEPLAVKNNGDDSDLHNASRDSEREVKTGEERRNGIDRGRGACGRVVVVGIDERLDRSRRILMS
jgi:hypothetical protein